MLKTHKKLARSGGMVAATAATLAMVAAGCTVGPPQGNAAIQGTATKDVAAVVEIDVTSSVANSFRTSAQDAIAGAIVRRAGQPHGVIHLYVRKIDHNPGDDSAAIATYRIPAVYECSTANPFDQNCRRRHERTAAEAVSKAKRIARKIRALRVRVAHAGTVIRGGLAIAGEILAKEPGEKWLVVASDMRPSSTKRHKRPLIKLDNVNVVVLYACSQGIAHCQERQNAWQAELEHDGAVRPVTFLFSQQMPDLWR
jgi:hypothetical protein